LMNQTSSRSHSIFTIVVECADSTDRGDHIRVGKLNLVDLAGSERQSKVGAASLHATVKHSRMKFTLCICSGCINLFNRFTLVSDDYPSP
jgi:hypothetical protein